MKKVTTPNNSTFELPDSSDSGIQYGILLLHNPHRVVEVPEVVCLDHDTNNDTLTFYSSNKEDVKSVLKEFRRRFPDCIYELMSFKVLKS